MSLEVEVGKRFARAVTRTVIARPMLWRLLRAPLRLQFQRLAGQWDTMRPPGGHVVVGQALEGMRPPRRALDLGTGTGVGAFVLAERFPDAEVLGVDLAPAMVEEARRKTPPELAARVRFEQGDASRLPFADASFELVSLLNMIPFFDELARVVAPGGGLVLAFSGGDQTPIWVPFERLREELGRRGFAGFAEVTAGPARALTATKR
jgi:SAM-dependent methyltransferase